MRDPYDILGVARGASFEEVKAAYRRASKKKHPDLGGSHEEFIELQTAYDWILRDLKRGYQEQREQTSRQQGEEQPHRQKAEQEEAPRQQQRRQDSDEEANRRRERAYRDIDEELEALRRESEAREEKLRAMRNQAWESGDRATWAKLTWDDLARFMRTILRSGLKGLALLFAALVGIGSVLVQANVVSAIIILGSGIGVLVSMAFKNDKGGIFSASLLLFGVMTIWLPPVRAALFTYPLATLSVLVCLGLIFKFAQQGGIVGFTTGGVLALYIIFVIVNDAQPPPQVATRPATPVQTPERPTATSPSPSPPPSSRSDPPPAAPSPPPVQRGDPAPAQPTPPTRPAQPPARPSPSAIPPPEPPAEPRTLLAAKGTVLKFVAGVPYQLRVRSGSTTLLQASQGQFAFYSGSDRVGPCTDRFEVSMRAAPTPYQDLDRMIRACGTDAIARVVDVR